MIQKKINSKKYLKEKLSKGAILFWIIFGFIIGSTLGTIFYQQDTDETIKLTLVYSSEKSTWISESQILFMEYWQEKQQNDPTIPSITLDFQPYGSGDSLISLLNGEIKPVIWSPASNIWIPILNSKWTQLTGNNDLIVENYTRLIYSPVVIATWESFYQEHPFNGFEDLEQIIEENPDLVTLAHTDPRESNSGFMATVMMVSGKLNMDPSLITIEDISNPDVISWMTSIESAAIFYGKSTGFLGLYMRDQGPEALKVAILYENLVQDYSISAMELHGDKLIAIYPEEGVLYSDHPFCILNADWINPEQKLLAEEYLSFISQKNLISKAIESGFRPIDNNLLEDNEIQSVYNQSFNEDHGVSADPSIILEIFPPTDGTVISRIPDLWLLTRNSV